MRSQSPFLTILLLWGSGLGAAAQFGKISVLFDMIAIHYPGASTVSLGLMLSISGIVGVGFGTMAGLLVQGLGYRRVLVAALAGGAVLSALEALLPPLPLMLLLRIGEGLSHLAIVVAVPVLIAQLAPQKHQSLAMTLWSSFFSISFAFTAFLGLPFAEAHGVGAVFLFHAGYMGLFAVIMLAALPRDGQITLPSLDPRDLLRRHGQIYASPNLGAPALGFFFYTVIYIAVLTFFPPLIGGEWQGVVAITMPLVSIAVSLTLGVALMHRYPAFRVVQGGFALVALVAIPLWFFWGTEVVMFLGAFLLAAILGVVQGASFATVPQLNPGMEERAQASGALAQIGNLGIAVGTPILAFMLTNLGGQGLALFVLLPSLIGICVHESMARRRARWA
ncbi:MAG: MFS transporter [Pseudorhodobacter sp.]